MNAHILGDWLVWESMGCVSTLDTSLISSTAYYGPEHHYGIKTEVYCRDESSPTTILEEGDATWFHTWWMQRLEEEEKVEAEWREEERKRREKQAKTTDDEEPA